MHTVSNVVSPLPAHSVLVLIVGLTVLLLSARLLGMLAGVFGLPAIVGELTAGILLGPSLLGVLAPDVSHWLMPANRPEQLHLVDAVAQLGVLLLVGVTGTHLDLKLLRTRRRTVVTVSLGGLLVPLGLGIGLGLLLPVTSLAGPAADRGTFACFLGVAMCVSAIPVIAKTLADMRLLHRNVGQLTLAAGTVDDVVGWFLLSVISAAVVSVSPWSGIPLAVAGLCGFLLFAVLVARPVVAWALQRAANAAENGPVISTAVIVVLIGAAITTVLGMEPIFGAFVAGILVGASGIDQTRLAGLRTTVMSVLAPLFLATAGLRVDLGSLATASVALAGLVVLATAVAGKFAGAYLGARISRLTPWESVAIGAGLNARGVVEVVVALTGLRLGILNTASYSIVVLVAVVTSLMAPPMLRRAMDRVAQDSGEHLRRLDHEAWNGMTPGQGDRPVRGRPVDRRAPR